MFALPSLDAIEVGDACVQLHLWSWAFLQRCQEAETVES